MMDVVGGDPEGDQPRKRQCGQFTVRQNAADCQCASKQYYLDRRSLRVFQCSPPGDIHIHDLDFYGKTLNCIQIPLRKLLQEGFNRHGYKASQRPASATALAAIILQSSQNDMFGGQSFPSLTGICPLLRTPVTRKPTRLWKPWFTILTACTPGPGPAVPFSSLNLGSDTSEAWTASDQKPPVGL